MNTKLKTALSIISGLAAGYYTTKAVNDLMNAYFPPSTLPRSRERAIKVKATNNLFSLGFGIAIGTRTMDIVSAFLKAQSDIA